MTDTATEQSDEAPNDPLGQLDKSFLGGFNELLGLKIDERGPDTVRGHVTIHAGLLQPYGIVHGGVYASLAESVASLAGATWNLARVPAHVQSRTVGVSNATSFLRAVREGTLTIIATPLHRGRTLQLWQVLITDESGRLVAKSDVRLANLDPSPEAWPDVSGATRS
jgi:1,4-dihydroxy-2-naphthoyl-CoA hydrolase